MIRLLGNGPRDVTLESRKPLWLYPNLLSLDAPLVALAWLYIFAKTFWVYLPWEVYISLGLVVWVIYVSDRLLDAALRGTVSGKIQARHEFHRKHQRLFKTGAIIAAVVAVVVAVSELRYDFYGYLWIMVALVLGFFGLSLATAPDSDEIPYAKNVIAGLAFAYGTAISVYAYKNFGVSDLLLSGEFICFAALCILNILAIDLWEHADRYPDPELKATDELALTVPLALLGAGALVFALLDHEISTRPFFYAVLTGAALLHVLNTSRARLSMESLRVLADVALLVPFIVFIAFRNE